MTDLKAANQMLAEAPEHDADVSEAEAIRNRLLDLDYKKPENVIAAAKKLEAYLTGKMTDLKTANMMLANAIAALESPEHDADVSEAEAIRNRLLDLDAAIGERIQAKLDAHRLIIDQWGVSEVIVPRKLEEADEPIVSIEDPLAACDADAWDARLAAIDADAGKAAGNYQDWLAQQKTKLYVQDTNAAPTAVEVVIEDPLAAFDADTCDGEPVLTAFEWEAHREEHASEYSLTGDEVPDAVLVNGVAEMPQVEQSDGQ